MLNRLTARERQILAQMAQGRSNAAIAKALVLSERAVAKHINSIFTKLEMRPDRDHNRRVLAVVHYLLQTSTSATLGPANQSRAT